ncbi:putative transcription factor C2H2 family [Medicago truncatula]|uniref:RBR-type E3 ubiquitin transferase n=1 Tax=Medicago truncatula TaxID=3880 RepID=A0A396IDQ3_MEDTR|nr:putative transcription factor C2H2 family [Medicago truncatula]
MEGTSPSSTADDFYFSAIHDKEIFRISEETYAEELQIQEALLFSTLMSNTTIDVKNEIQVVDAKVDLKQKQKEAFVGESSSSSSQLKQSYCAICMEAKPVEEMFQNQKCSHSFCEDCLGRYLAAKIQESISMVKCPDPKCNDILEPHDCCSILPKDVFDRWENALCENMVLGSQKFYCPFNDCSAMLLNDEKGIVTASECPHCHRLFCAQCKVSWHIGVDCKEFLSLKDGERGREDLMAMELAKNKRWKRCPKCGFYVEKIVGLFAMLGDIGDRSRISLIPLGLCRGQGSNPGHPTSPHLIVSFSY